MGSRILQLCLLITVALVININAQCPQVPGCNTCANPDIQCYTCLAGYYKVDDKTCKECTTNCLVCDDSTTTKCKTCESGYVLKSDGTCFSCGSGCAGCKLNDAEDAATCETCNKGKYLDSTSKQCKSCKTNCADCAADTSCKTCAAGYVINTDTTDASKLCISCPTHCTKCSGEAKTGTSPTESKCTACDSDYYLSADACVVCDDGDCAKCILESGKCEVDGCKDGFFKTVESASCAVCVTTKCKTCADATTCDTCKDTYGIKTSVQNTCDACDDPNCLVCDTATGTCGTCAEGYKADTTCKPCVANCKKCDTDITKCDAGECKDYFGIHSATTSDGTCKACPDNCKVCATDNAVCEATANCDPGFSKDTTPGDLCVECPDKCNACASDNAECDTGECEEGYGLEGGTTCIQCTDNCLACDTAADKCDATSCAEGYMRDSTTLLCNKCTVSDCKVCDTNKDVCDNGGCKPGFYYKDTTCKPCPGSCNKCDTDGANSKCDTGECAGKHVRKTDGSCAACPDNCEDCEMDGDTVKCKTDQCSSGFGLTSGGTCGACGQGCKNCPANSDGVLVCNTCLSKFHKNVELCGKCPSKCDVCSFDTESGSMVCETCSTGHAKNSDNECKACPTGCSECKASGSDILCNAGKCAVGSGVSSDKKSCTACATLTTVAQCTSCQDAPQNGTAQCDSCASGFALKDDHTECTSTSADYSGCALVQDKGFLCSECESSYNLTAEKQCSIKCYTCGAAGAGKAGEECNKDGATYTSAYCLGACWTEHSTPKDGTSTVARYCSADPCTNDYMDAEKCDEANDLKSCKSCCTGNDCNTRVLTGSTQSGSTLLTANAIFILLSALTLLNM